MNLKFLYPIIAVVSVAVMIIWGTLANSYQHSWLAVFVGGIAMAVLSFVIAGTKDKNDRNKK